MDDRLRLRAAAAGDMPAIARIYGHYVETSCCTFEEVPPAAEEMVRRWQQIRAAGLPWRVAENGAGVIGYAYAGRFRARSGYRYTVENSVYVAHDELHRGLGLALMRALIADCTALGYRQMLAVIGDSANAASIRLHARLGLPTGGPRERGRAQVRPLGRCGGDAARSRRRRAQRAHRRAWRALDRQG